MDDPQNAAGCHRRGAQVDSRIVVHKFGGSSLAGAERVGHAASLVREAAAESRVAVVVSAMRGITNRLLSISKFLKCDEPSLALAEAQSLVRLHRETAQNLGLEGEKKEQLFRAIERLGQGLIAEVHLRMRRTVDARGLDRIASFGERFSGCLFAAALEHIGLKSVAVAASDFLVTTCAFQNARPLYEETRVRARAVLFPWIEAGLVPVVTGFIGATRDGRVTTLGRNSSDFSGAVVAHALEARELVIWTDVDGIYSADPQRSSSAELLEALSYEEAHALARNGAKVLHPDVLPLAAESNMVVWVRNTFKPRARGTRIGPKAEGGAP